MEILLEYVQVLINQNILWSILLIGGAVGLLSAILGLGGGVVMVPLLPLLVGVGQRETMTISLATVTLIVCVNTIVFHRRGLVRWRLSFVMGGVAAVAAFISGLLSFLIPEFALEFLLFGLLALLALKTALDKQLKKFTAEHQFNKKTARKGYVIWGILSGCVSGLTGLGSGVLVAPILLGFPWVKNKRIAPTANAVMLLTTPAALLAFLIKGGGSGGVDGSIVPWWTIVLLLFIPAFLFSTIGHRFQHWLKDTQRRYVLMSLLSVLSVIELINALKAINVL